MNTSRAYSSSSTGEALEQEHAHILHVCVLDGGEDDAQGVQEELEEAVPDGLPVLVPPNTADIEAQADLRERQRTDDLTWALQQF